MLRQVKLKNFKSFKNGTLDLGPLTLIVGTNASGKSNIRDAFRFVHGISRGYSIAEILGEKWIEGGVLQWKGIRGGSKEAAFYGSSNFSVSIGFDAFAEGDGSYEIEIDVGPSGSEPRVIRERLSISKKGKYVFDSHPDNDSSLQSDPFHLAVRLRKNFQRGWKGPVVNFLSSRPVLAQMLDHPEVKIPAIKEHAQLAISAMKSMRFLDLHPDAMRSPSIPGQTILGDRGENLSSVLYAICKDEKKKAAVIEWVRELTPLDVSDFEFQQDPTGKILVILAESGGARVSAYSASDGTLRFLAMIAAIVGPEPSGFYFFEELENGIHPTRLHLLLQLIEQQTSKTAIQIVATTHSPQLLGFLNGASRENAALVFRKSPNPDSRVVGVLSIPHIKEILMKQDFSRLMSSGWLENTVALLEEAGGD